MTRQNDRPAVTGTSAYVARFQATIASSPASSRGVMAAISAQTSARSMPPSRYLKITATSDSTPWTTRRARDRSLAAADRWSALTATASDARSTSPAPPGSASGVERLCRAEELEVDPFIGDVQRPQPDGQHPHEPLGPAEVEVGLRHRHVLLEPVHRDPAFLVIVPTTHVLRGRELIEDDGTHPGMVSNDLLEMLPHRMVAAGQRGMDIPDVPLSTLGHDRVKHRQDRCEPDPATQQDQRSTVLLAQEEVAGRGAHPHHRSRPTLIVQVVGCQAGRGIGGVVGGALALDADPVGVLAGGTGDTVVPHHLAVAGNVELEGEVLTGLEAHNRPAVAWSQIEGGDDLALGYDPVDDELAPAQPATRRRCPLVVQLLLAPHQDLGQELISFGPGRDHLLGGRLAEDVTQRRDQRLADSRIMLGRDVEGDVLLGDALHRRAQLLQPVDVGRIGVHGPGQRARLGSGPSVVGLVEQALDLLVLEQQLIHPLGDLKAVLAQHRSGRLDGADRPRLQRHISHFALPAVAVVSAVNCLPDDRTQSGERDTTMAHGNLLRWDWRERGARGAAPVAACPLSSWAGDPRTSPRWAPGGQPDAAVRRPRSPLRWPPPQTPGRPRRPPPRRPLARGPGPRRRPPRPDGWSTPAPRRRDTPAGQPQGSGRRPGPRSRHTPPGRGGPHRRSAASPPPTGPRGWPRVASNTRP